MRDRLQAFEKMSAVVLGRRSQHHVLQLCRSRNDGQEGLLSLGGDLDRATIIDVLFLETSLRTVMRFSIALRVLRSQLIQSASRDGVSGPIRYKAMSTPNWLGVMSVWRVRLR